MFYSSTSDEAMATTLSSSVQKQLEELVLGMLKEGRVDEEIMFAQTTWRPTAPKPKKSKKSKESVMERLVREVALENGRPVIEGGGKWTMMN